jgi:glycosyltransferase involved in cell wall biosynthesis
VQPGRGAWSPSPNRRTCPLGRWSFAHQETTLHSPSVTVVFPAYDESAGIGTAVEETLAALGTLLDQGVIRDYELIVVDDGSRDGTAAIVETWSSNDDRVVLLSHPANRGVGAALRTALAVAQGEVLVYTDADMPVDLTEIRPALELLERPGVGMVAGQRSNRGAEGGFREFASRSFDASVRAMFGFRGTDVNFPFKVLEVETARALGLRSEGALIDVELMIRVSRLGLAISPMTVEYRARQLGRSKTMTFRLLSRLGFEMVRNRRDLRS